MRKKFLSLREFAHLVWNVCSSLYMDSIKRHHCVRYFWHTFRRSALCCLQLYISNSKTHQATEFCSCSSTEKPSDGLSLTEGPYSWGSRAHENGAGLCQGLRRDPEHKESQAAGGEGSLCAGAGVLERLPAGASKARSCYCSFD